MDAQDRAAVAHLAEQAAYRRLQTADTSDPHALASAIASAVVAALEEHERRWLHLVGND